MSIQKQPHPRDVRYLTFVTHRLNGLSDKEIAVKLNLGSPTALYQRLNLDGYPVCLVCGEAPASSPHCEPPKEGLEPTKRKAGTGTEKYSALPPPDNATELFRKALAKLTREVEELEHRRETYTGGRFVGTDVHEGSLLLSRKDVDAEKWRELCEQHGSDPEDDTLWLSGAVLRDPAGGGFRAPTTLAALIGTYLLAEEPLEPLLEVLHPAHRDANVEEISKYVEGRKKPNGKDGLKVLAGQIATLVRGGAVKIGTPPVPLTPREQNFACTITDYREAGLSIDEICLTLAPSGLSKQDVKRLAEMHLNWPKD